MVILGIDPGTATTGYGVIKIQQKNSNPKLLDFGVITTPAKQPDSERLATLAQDLQNLLKKYCPVAVGVEKLFFTTNQKTAMSVAQARGVVLLICQQANAKVFEFTPLQAKNFISGYGKASKTQIQYIVQKTFKLKTPPKPDDASDAVALALCTAHYYQKIFNNLSTRH